MSAGQHGNDGMSAGQQRIREVLRDRIKLSKTEIKQVVNGTLNNVTCECTALDELAAHFTAIRMDSVGAKITGSVTYIRASAKGLAELATRLYV